MVNANESAPPTSLARPATYDVIVIGARCAGAATALLLARRGVRVLLVDRATFPSDTMRAHYLRGGAISSLARWGLLEPLAATGCPPITAIATDFGDGPLLTPIVHGEGVPSVYSPRRHVLDTLLVQAAAAAGAEVRQAFTVRELIWEDGAVAGIRGLHRRGKIVEERAALVVGADGLHSSVARAVGAPVSDLAPATALTYYSYFGGEPLPHAMLALGADFGIIATPTHENLAMIAVCAPISRLPEFRHDIGAAFVATLARAPWLAAMAAGRARMERWRGTGDLPSFFRRPFGPGWALVGDAGYHQDPMTARGISNALRDAELLSRAIVAGLESAELLTSTLGAYERERNAAAQAGFAEARAWATFQPMPPQLLAQRAALHAAA